MGPSCTVVVAEPMTTQKVTPVEYAEQTLGVHAVYAEAMERLGLHQKYTDDVNRLNGNIRVVKDAIADKEATLVAQEGAAAGSMSKTAFKEHIKSVIDSDREVRLLRDGQSEAEAARAESDAHLKHHHLGVLMLTARMQELGGLLHFYSAAKSAGQPATSPQVH